MHHAAEADTSLESSRPQPSHLPRPALCSKLIHHAFTRFSFFFFFF